MRRDGTLRNPVPIWVVRDGDGLYVRSYRGPGSSWLPGAQERHEGHIRAGDVEKNVTFAEETDSAVNDQIDDAYRGKCRRYGSNYADPMVGTGARAATLKLMPR